MEGHDLYDEDTGKKIWYGSTETMIDKKNTDSNLPSIDDMLDIFGFGPYQWILDGVFFLMVMATSPYPVMMYFASATSTWRCKANSTTCLFNDTMPGDDDVRCDLRRNDWVYTEEKSYSTITEYDLSCGRNWVNFMTSSVFFIGWSFGAVVLGSIADNYGRKTVLVPSFITSIALTFVSAFLPNVFVFVLCRALIGFLLPGVWVQTFVLISEVVCKRYRACAGQLIKLGHTTGYCMLGVIAYFVRNWRMLHVYCSAPFFIFILSFKFVPESTRWARLRGKHHIVSKNLKNMLSWNKKKLPESFVKSLIFAPAQQTSKKSSVLDIFGTRLLLIMSFVQGYGWFALAAVYYGLLLAAKNIGGSIYLNFILLSLADLPALGVGIFLLDYCGRKKTVVGAMVLGGLCSIVIGIIPDTRTGSWSTPRIALSMLGKCGVNMALNCMYTWSSELYPTSLRSIGLGFLQLTAHISAAMAPWIAEGLRSLSEQAPFIVMGILVIAAALLSLLLGETRDVSMIENHHQQQV